MLADGLSRLHSEENHRWTQMDTDSEGRTPVLLRLALGHCPVNGFSSRKSAVLGRAYLCLSVSICGCIELFRFRDRTQVETGKRTHNPFPRPGVPKWYTEGAPPQCLSPTVSPPPPLPKKRGDKVGIRWGTGGCAAQVSLFDHLAERVGRWNANGLRSFSPELDRRGKGVRSYPGKGVR